jgi:hypothetical protein
VVVTEEKKRGSKEIQAFVQTTLVSIYDAITETNYTPMTEGIGISISSTTQPRPKPINQVSFEMPRSVKFDIAITATEDSSVNGGLDLKIAKFGTELSGSQSSVNRVEFEVPVLAPRREV